MVRLFPMITAVAAMLASPSAAQSVAVSEGPQSVSVTVYRAQHRGPNMPMRLEWLQGYALITETRTIAIPAGEVDIRFEGVAGGIVPQTAIVTGLADGVLERNRDARLLSPEGLLDASLGRRVTLRRTNRATGETRENDAIARSGPDGAVVLETSEGFEALRCTGLRETIVYPGVPAGLSPRPTLSVRTRAMQAVNATVTLSYLASGFDWQTNYVATIDHSGRTLDLFAWVTLANGDQTSFADATASAVAGEPNRVGGWVSPPSGGPLRLRCWQDGVVYPEVRGETEDHYSFAIGDAIVVTAQRTSNPSLMASSPLSIVAVQENVGDLKLYRIPEPVTIAARSQKQVAMFARENVPFERFYRASPQFDNRLHSAPMSVVYRMRNTERGRLGLPLPQGSAAIFALGERRPVLVAEATSRDVSVGDDFELEGGASSQVQLETQSVIRDSREEGTQASFRLRVTNATGASVRVEIPITPLSSPAPVRANRRLVERDGMRQWHATVPANGEAVLTYTIG